MKAAQKLLSFSVWKVALVIPLIIFFVLIFKLPVFAATQSQTPVQSQTTVGNQYMAPNTDPNVPRNMHTYTQSVVIELLSSAICQLSGYDPISTDHKCLGINQLTGKIGFTNQSGGVIGMMGNLIQLTYTPPTSSSQYIGYLSQNFGFPKKALAATDCTKDPSGYGFCSINPLTNMWLAMRNLVYLLFTVIFIIIGVAIMLRIHIDPRTVMTVENQIPKIIVGILLVTFSLAIAGFLIDIMYVAIYLVGHVLLSIPGNTGLTADLYNSAVNSNNPFQTAGTITKPIGGFMGIASNVQGALSGVIGTVVSFQILGIDVLGLVIGLILWLIVLIALLYALLRVWITLIIAYISILLDIVFAPFWFIAGLLPGSSLGVGGWFKDLISNLAVFPAVIIMYTLAVIFSRLGDNTGGNPLFQPPMVGGLGTTTIGGLIMFGFIFMTPQVLSMVKAAIKAPKINFGPVAQPLIVAAGGVSALPKRFTEAGIRYRYTAGASSNLERITGLFGSPYYLHRPGPPPEPKH